MLDCVTPVFGVFDPEKRVIGAWPMESDGVPFGFAYAFGPDGRLYAIAGGDRADYGTPGPAG